MAFVSDSGQSPYWGLSIDKWEGKTLELIEAHPLTTDEIVEVVLEGWSDIFASEIGAKRFRIGAHIFPRPQIMAFFLHELIPLELANRYPNLWRPEATASDKDLVYIPDDLYSVEIKTSSSARQIFGNRSYAQVGATSKKSKTGYYLAINFSKFTSGDTRPGISRIRFGWLDHEDWFGQHAETGQQARLNKDSDRYKMQLLYG